jgi:single-stranded-DNA-specific exonuclease
MGRKKWIIQSGQFNGIHTPEIDDILRTLFDVRGINGKKEQVLFVSPKHPRDLTAEDVGIDPINLQTGLERIIRAVKNKEHIVVYSDYDADGITAGAVLWETLHELGAWVMPYIPSRADEGYGLSKKGIDSVKADFDATLIVTVDHGITAREFVNYAREKGIDVVVSDHHVKPDLLPECPIIHTTKLSGSGVSWFIAHALIKALNIPSNASIDDELSLAAIGTIADMVPLTGPNRSIAKFGLGQLNQTKRVGLIALIELAGIMQGKLGTYDISHVLAPRLNAMGRLVHAMDALRILCTRNAAKAKVLAETLGDTNKERQQLTLDSTTHALELAKECISESIIVIASDTYNQGIIGLVAGKLVESFYKPAIVIALGEVVSKASARSIVGFNIVEAIRSTNDLLIDVGGHPMAAGFTLETKHIDAFTMRMRELARKLITEDMLQKKILIDACIPLSCITEDLWDKLQTLEPFGFGNPEPLFVTRKIQIVNMRMVGAEGKHLKVKIQDPETKQLFDAIAFGFGTQFSLISSDLLFDIVYTIDMNVWNGKRTLQLKIRDLQPSEKKKE